MQRKIGVRQVGGGRILVAEDNAVNQRLMVKVLNKLNYTPEVVADGRSAVDAALDGDYAAILMDCQMPEMDGFEATVEIRRKEGPERRVPIIALTASAMRGDSDRCFAAGMDDYLAKPVDLALLGDTLRRCTDPAMRASRPATSEPSLAKR